MGRRKERRNAAMGATGRRVKLDLFAEPSGDLGGSSIPDEVGGEGDSKNRAGLPNSPASSGQQPQNPLLLLGQYSDDELDEGSKEGGSSDDAKSPVGDTEEQANADAVIDDKSVGVNEGNDSAMQKVEQFILEMDSDLPDSSEKSPEDGNIEKKAIEHEDRDITEQVAPATSDKQAIVEATSGWKMVLHEESNQYYYWNVATGETSWEVPDVLDQATDSALEVKAAAHIVEQDDQDDAIAFTHKGSMIVGGEVDSTCMRSSDVSNTASQNVIAIDNDGQGQELEALKEGGKNGALGDKIEGGDNDQGMLQDNPIDTQHHETPLTEDCVSSRPSIDALVGNGSAFIEDSVKCRVDMRQNGEYESGAEFSSRLMEHCEYLLEQLKCINRSKDDLILRCITEVEIRLTDIKSLASHGSSMLPFWVYSEEQLKHLQETINNVAYQHLKDGQMNEIEDSHEPNRRVGDAIEAGLSEKASACPPNGDLSAPMLVGEVVQKDPYCKASNDGANASDAGGTVEVDGLASQSDITPQTVLHCGEDADMDVDMEVEDAVPPDESDSQFCKSAEQLNLQNLYQGSSVSELALSVPPQPDEDWVPPPPPDNEPYPPPPPEEPPETPHPPPPGSESVQNFSYTDQYNQSYPGTYDYYGQTNTEVPGTSFYAYSEGFQVAVSHPSVYYEAVPTMYSATPVMVNPIDPGAYYTLQDGLVHPTSVGSGIESSGISSVSGFKSFNSDTLRSLHGHSQADFVISPNTKDDGPEVSGEMEKASLKLPSSQAITAISVAESVSGPSTTGVITSVADSATAVKGPSKVPRTKKRTVSVASTLRSNKKVSSMVDKWKAAKEEMHEEEEEEPETYLEKLEKKRKREIEQWRAQQIASGEAKENANFQPLGGDWRERVKRKKAQLLKEREQSPLNGVSEGIQQPDLNELSKGLPSSWQAYWDDTSKQVYYGNTVTSETSWIRPTT